VVYIGSPNDGYLLSLPLEYKTKSPIAVQLTTTYDHGLIVDEGDVALKFTPEVRYYFRNHFTGIYMQRYETIHNDKGIYASDRLASMERTKCMAFGAFYGYQREFNRLIIEGQAGAGITFNLNDSVEFNELPLPNRSYREPSVSIFYWLFT
jgi:hypothetical protein